MGKRIVTVLLVSMGINLLGPAAGTVREAVVGGMSDPSVMVQFLLNFNVPLQQLSDIVKNENPLSEGIRADTGKDREEIPAGINCCTSQNRGSGVSSTPTNGNVWSCSPGSGIVLHHWPPGIGQICILLFLMYIVLLAKSNLPGEIVFVRGRKEQAQL